MKILITGGGGLLGTALVRSMPTNFEVGATFRSALPTQPTDHFDPYQLDICDRDTLMDIVHRVHPDWIIHTASIGNVDYCEQHQDESWQVNVVGTQHVIEACTSCHIRLIYTSSNAVFDGDHAPYSEEDPTNPKHHYGKTKLASERLIQESGLDATIIRPMMMYGWNTPPQRSNPVTWMLSELSQHKALRLFDDVYGNPLLVSQCADAIWICVRDQHYGFFHIAGKDRVSVYELGQAVALVFEYDASLLQPVSRDALPQLVHRPTDTTYRTDKMETVLGLMPLSLLECLQQMKEAPRA